MSHGISGEGVLRKLLEQMNAHVPSRRRWLSELVQMDQPSYSDRSGREFVISKEELELIQRTLQARDRFDVKLPIVLIADSSMPQSTWRVEGEEECAVVAAILDRTEPEPSGRMFLYPAHVGELRRRLPTATTCIFVP